MREGIKPASHNSLPEVVPDDTNSSSYASRTGLLFVVVIVALSATGLSLVSFSH